MAMHPPVVVFSDVDGVLADPSFRAAASELILQASDRLALVLCSSRTRAELEHVWQGIGDSQPFICEHGGAVFIPHRYFGFEVPNARDLTGSQAVEFGRSYATVVDILHRTAVRLGIGVRGFNDMSVEEVARDCHMSLPEARLAKLRDYGEFFRVLDPSAPVRARLFKGLHAANLRCIGGEPYHHVGAAVDKDLGVSLLLSLFRRKYGSVRTVGLAEAASDSSLLQFVDFPVIVKSADSSAMPRILKSAPQARVTRATGVDGWVETITDVVGALSQQSSQLSEATAYRSSAADALPREA